MKSLINYALLKEQLKRFWAIAALSILWYGFLVVMPLYSAASNMSPQYTADQMLGILAMKNFPVMAASIVVPFVAVMSMFSYLFQPKSTAAMHSFPINKKQLYITNTAAALVLIIIPLLILCGFLLKPVIWHLPEMRFDAEGVHYFGYVPQLPADLFPNGLEGGAVINTLPLIVGFFIRTLISFIFYLALFLLAVTATGNAVIYVLLSGALPLIPIAIMTLGIVTGTFYFFGFTAHEADQAVLLLFTYTNPVAVASAFSFYHPAEAMSSANSSLYQHYVVYIIIAAVLFAASYWCYHIRRQERAGDSVVFVPLRNVLVFLLSMLGMVLLGSFFLAVFKKVAFLYVGFGAGFVIAYFIAQMIAEKTFNVLYKARDLIKYGAVMAVLFLIVIITARMDLFGYQAYTPQAEEVAGIYLYQPHTLRDYTTDRQTEAYKQSHFITDESIIANTLSVHKQIVNERHSLRSVYLKNLEGNNNYAEREAIEQSIIYLLKDGTYVCRLYTLPKEFMQRSGLIDLLSEEAVILSPYSILKRPGEINKISLEYRQFDATEKNTVYTSTGVVYYENGVKPVGDTIYYEAVQIEETAEILSVLEEIKKDYVISERGRLMLDSIEKDETKKTVSAYLEVKVPNGMRSDTLSLDSFENIDRWLEIRGLTPKVAE